jgi:hypothetical protein
MSPNVLKSNPGSESRKVPMALNAAILMDAITYRFCNDDDYATTFVLSSIGCQQVLLFVSVIGDGGLSKRLNIWG